MRTNIPLAVRALRRRRRWRQNDLGRRAGLSRDVVSRAERGGLDGITIGSLSRLATALDATLVVEVWWRGADLDRLVDRAHAALEESAARRLTAAGWNVRAEVSFNHYGERGRCDLVALHGSTRTLLIVEAKSRIGDVQDLLGRLDVKVRVGGVIAQQLAWPKPARIIAALVLAEDRTSRRIVDRHEALFGRFAVRGRSALAALRTADRIGSGLLWWEDLPDSSGSSITAARRVRLRRPAGQRRRCQRTRPSGPTTRL